MVSNYADMIIMRHPLREARVTRLKYLMFQSSMQGDGANQHPSQTLLDMYSIMKTQGRLDDINLFMVGDLKYGRTVHSLLMAMSQFKNPIFNFVAPRISDAG